MKKTIAFALSLLFCVGFVACDNQDDYSVNWDDIYSNLEQIGSSSSSSSNTDSGETERPVSNNIALPSSSKDYKNENYIDVLEDLESAGFTNIKFEIIYDLITGWLTSNGEIEEVLIDGNPSFFKGDIFAKDTEIIIKYHTWASDEPKITMPHYSGYYDDGWTVERLVEHFEELGFINVVTKTVVDSGMFEEFHQEGEVYNVEIEDTTLGSWNSGDVFGATSQITIHYYERTYTLTVDNCSDLESILSSRDMMYSDFAERYDGQFIEFDGCVQTSYSYMGGTSYVISVSGGNYNSDGASGWIIRVDVEQTVGDEKYIDKNINKGSNVKVIGKIDDYYTDYYDMICIKAAYLMDR